MGRRGAVCERGARKLAQDERPATRRYRPPAASGGRFRLGYRNPLSRDARGGDRGQGGRKNLNQPGTSSFTFSQGRHSLTPSGVTTIGRSIRVGWAVIASSIWSSVTFEPPRCSDR